MKCFARAAASKDFMFEGMKHEKGAKIIWSDDVFIQFKVTRDIFQNRFF